MKEFIQMWKYNKMIVLALLSGTLYAALLIPFEPLVVVPGIAELRLGLALPVVLGLFFGPAGALGVFLGGMLYGLIAGLGLSSLILAFSSLILALLPYKLWNRINLCPNLDFCLEKNKIKKSILNFILTSSLGVLGATLVISWFLSLRGSSFTAMAMLMGTSGLLMTLIPGGILFLSMGSRVMKWEMHWTQIMNFQEGGLATSEKSKGSIYLGTSLLIYSPPVGFVGCFLAALMANHMLATVLGFASILAIAIGVFLID